MDNLAYRSIVVVATALSLLISCSPPPTNFDQPTAKKETESSSIMDTPLHERERPVVHGTLMLLSDKGTIPVENTILYLAETIENTEGVDSFAAMDRMSSPKAVTDETGKFIFEKVPVGRYGLIMDRIVASYLLFEPGTADSIIIMVDEGSLIDLGKLQYDSLPMP